MRRHLKTAPPPVLHRFENNSQAWLKVIASDQLWQKYLGTMMITRGFFSALIQLAVLVPPTWAEETCLSPYLAKIVGPVDYVSVWTLDLGGVRVG